MLNLKELQEKMKSILGEMEICQKKISEAKEGGNEEALAAGKSLFADQEKQFDGLKVQAEEAQKHQARRTLQLEVTALAEAETKGKNIIPDGDVALPIDHQRQGIEEDKIFFDWVRGKKVDDKAFKVLEIKSERMKSASDDSRDAVRMPDRFACRMLGSTYMQAMGKTMYSVAVPRTDVLNPSAAQNLIPQDFRATLLQLPYDQPTAYDRVTVVAAPTGSVTWPVLTQTDSNEFGGVVFQWTGEGAEKPETEPEFEQLEITVHDLCGYTEISEKLLSRSAVNLENLLATLYRGAMVYEIDRVIINGSGSGQPLGIVNTSGIRSVARQVASEVSDLDLVNLKHAVKPQHRGGANYLLEDSVEQYLEGTTDSLGRPLFRASTANGPYDRLVGYPYLVSTNNPTLGNDGDVIFGNLRYYILAQEEDIVLARSEHYKFRHNLVAFKVYTNIGGRLVQPRALSILGGVSDS